jgi:hypothetical protein
LLPHHWTCYGRQHGLYPLPLACLSEHTRLRWWSTGLTGPAVDTFSLIWVGLSGHVRGSISLYRRLWRLCLTCLGLSGLRQWPSWRVWTWLRHNLLPHLRSLILVATLGRRSSRLGNLRELKVLCKFSTISLRVGRQSQIFE